MNNKKEIFNYLVSYYNIDKIPIFGKNNEICYILDVKTMVFYDKYRIPMFDDVNCFEHHYLINLCYKQIETFVEIYKSLVSDEIVTAEIYFYNYDRNDIYPKSKIKRVENLCGTLDKIFEEFERKNNCYRYMNGAYYEFANEETKKLFRIWQSTLTKERSMKLYYGDGVVD